MKFVIALLFFMFSLLFIAPRLFAAPSVTVMDEELNDFITFSDTNFHSAFIKIYDGDNTLHEFIINNLFNKNYFVPDAYFQQTADACLMNIRFPLLDLKETKIYPYMNPAFFVKFIYLMKNIRFGVRISDVMRTYSEQLLYRRRGWSNVEASPHMVGLAGDMVYCPPLDKQYLQNAVVSLGMRYLEHGNRGNRHVHLQDNEQWKKLDTTRVQHICEELSKDMQWHGLSAGEPFKTYDKMFSERNTQVGISSLGISVAHIYIEDNLGRLKAEIICGVFEPGTNKILLNLSFLPRDIYQIKTYVNGRFYSQQVGLGS